MPQSPLASSRHHDKPVRPLLWVLGAALLAATVSTPATAQVGLVSRAASAAADEGSGGAASGLGYGFFSYFGSGAPTWSEVSADGRYVVFESDAPNLVAGIADENNTTDVFLWDRWAQQVELVSRAGASARAGNQVSHEPTISADARYVAFESWASDLMPGFVQAGSGAPQVYVHDRQSPLPNLSLVSHKSGLPSTASNDSSTGRILLSADGRFVAFLSRATDLVAGQVDGNNGADLFLHDRASGTATLASHAAATPATAGNGRTFTTAMSADGRYLAYESLASNLVAGQVDSGLPDVFLFDRVSGTNALVSHKLGFPATSGNDESGSPTISADGAFVAFSSGSTNLVAGTDMIGTHDVFLYDRASATNLLVSHVAGAPSTAANDYSGNAAISADGSTVAFLSSSSALVAGQVDPVVSVDVFVYQRVSGQTTLASHLPGAPTTAAASNGGLVPDLRVSADGRFVLYGTANSGLTPASDTNSAVDFLLFDGTTGENRLASGVAGGGAIAGDRGTRRGTLSADGAFVVLESEATNLVPGLQDVNGRTDIFVCAPASATLWMASRRVSGQPSLSAAGDSRRGQGAGISADGRYAVFVSDAANLVPGQSDDNQDTDVFLADLHTGALTLVSHAASSSSVAAEAASSEPVLSADGSHVAFLSRARNLVPGQVDVAGSNDVFVWERATSQLALVSHMAGAPGSAGGGEAAGRPVLSADGRYVAYAHAATNLALGQVDTNGLADVFLFDRLVNTNTLLSHAAGSAATAGDGGATAPELSADGRYVAFLSGATNLVPGQLDSNGLADAFLYDRASGATSLLSHATGLPANTADGASSRVTISSDGAKIVVESAATNLIPGLVNANGADSDLYLLDRASGAVALISHAAGSATTTGSWGSSTQAASSADGQWVAYLSEAPNLVPGQTGEGWPAAFLYSAAAGTSVVVSHRSDSVTFALDGGWAPAVSADGRFVAFSSYDDGIAPGQVEHNVFRPDVFLYDRDTGLNRLLSHVPSSANDTGNDYASQPALSANATAVVFQGLASDLVAGDFNARDDVFVTWNEQTPPSNPGSLASTTHAVSTWSRLPQIAMAWSGAADAGSGVAGYSVLFDSSPATTPDTTVDIPHAADPHATTSAPRPDGTGHYFHLRTCDQAGNCSAGLHAGPYWVDATPPTPVSGLASTSHAPGVPSADQTIDVVWTAAGDAGAGVDGYGLAFTGSAAPYCTQVKLVEEDVTSYSSATQPDGNRWVHVCALDNAGNWSAVATAGPYRIATQADLAVSQASPPVPLSALGTLSYTVTVSNGGGLDASGVTLSDTLSPGLAFVSSVPAAPTCTHAAGIVSCALGALAFQASTSVSITVTNAPGFIGPANSLATVTGDQPDGTLGNNSSSLDTQVVLQKGDLNNDAWPEILFRSNASGRYVAWLMNGTTRVTGRFVTPDPGSGDWLLSAVHDVDGDQRNDLAFWNQSTGAVEFWLMNGTERVGGTLPLTGAAPLPPQWALQASADFDHDGQGDLVWRHQATQQLVIWKMDGAARVGAIVPNPDHAVDANWQLVAALDANDDGNVDLLWYNRSSGRVVQWLMDANVQRLSGRFTTPPSAGNANWKVVAAADYGGDSSPLTLWNDILWRNADSGRLVVWHMDAAGLRIAGNFTTPEAPANPLGWTVVGPR